MPYLPYLKLNWMAFNLYLMDDDFKEACELCVNLANESFYKDYRLLFKEKKLCVPKSSIR
ncbi:hypothetical protein CR513_52936, partial [Mucuna pruriens]